MLYIHMASSVDGSGTIVKLRRSGHEVDVGHHLILKPIGDTCIHNILTFVESEGANVRNTTIMRKVTRR